MTRRRTGGFLYSNLNNKTKCLTNHLHKGKTEKMFVINKIHFKTLSAYTIAI